MKSSSSAVAALAIVKEWHPDVLLSDIAMPGAMDGVALAFALRKRFPALPVLLTTGYAERHQEACGGDTPSDARSALRVIAWSASHRSVGRWVASDSTWR